eukprot:CAMPEP_0172180212 /NCGR_PEP_ID=MMETSP1050-20130122/17081_1 /TAXON_ID=233186 /ORGANISM="Cryptomonas curvata, Strain CCAP979/52" /LENGTH=36 /DNA_ID= /DNA_START= /DNA_END= /DNA_ORIENTATION=
MRLDIDEVRFIFDGQRVHENNTPQALGMVDDDIIDA